MRSMPPGPSRGTRGSAWRFILLAVAAAQPQRKDLTIFYKVYMHNRTALARTPVVDAYPINWALAPRYRNGHPYRDTRIKRNARDVVAEWRAVYNETPPASSLLLRHYVETRQPPISPSRPGRPGKKNADLPRRKKKSAFQGRPAAAPRPSRKNWSPREVAAAIADEVGRNH